MKLRVAYMGVCRGLGDHRRRCLSAESVVMSAASLVCRGGGGALQLGRLVVGFDFAPPSKSIEPRRIGMLDKDKTLARFLFWARVRIPRDPWLGCWLCYMVQYSP